MKNYFKGSVKVKSLRNADLMPFALSMKIKRLQRLSNLLETPHGHLVYFRPRLQIHSKKGKKKSQVIFQQLTPHLSAFRLFTCHVRFLSIRSWPIGKWISARLIKRGQMIDEMPCAKKTKKSHDPWRYTGFVTNTRLARVLKEIDSLMKLGKILLASYKSRLSLQIDCQCVHEVKVYGMRRGIECVCRWKFISVYSQLILVWLIKLSVNNFIQTY